MVDLELRLVQSGFQVGNKVPYSSVMKVSHTLLNLDTCLNRLETQIYQVLLYDDNHPRLLRNIEKVEGQLDFSTLKIKNRKNPRVKFLDRFEDEPVEGLYFANLTYEVITQKEFDPEKVKRATTTADDFYSALRKRYLEHPILTAKTGEFVTTKYGKSEWDFGFLFIPSYNTLQDFLTTCTRAEATNFSIAIQHNNPDKIMDIQEDIDDIYSYCTFKLTGKRFTTLEWQSNTLVELEPEFWQGTVDYKLILEKEIAA